MVGTLRESKYDLRNHLRRELPNSGKKHARIREQETRAREDA